MKLTLRELFLLVALAALGCGWWVDRTHVVEVTRAQDALKWIGIVEARAEELETRLHKAELAKDAAERQADLARAELHKWRAQQSARSNPVPNQDSN